MVQTSELGGSSEVPSWVKESRIQLHVLCLCIYESSFCSLAIKESLILRSQLETLLVLRLDPRGS